MRNSVSIVMVLFIVGAAGAQPKDKDKTTPPATSQTTSSGNAFLGVGVEPVPPLLRNQLPEQLPNGQGVMVVHVTRDSAAAKAGLEPGDILLSYGDKKLTTPEELIKLLRADTPGNTVELRYLRGGKANTAKATLGTFPAPVFPVGPPDFPSDSKFDDSFWANIDSLKITRTDGDKFKAEIELRKKDGKKEMKTYTGTRSEIRQAILTEKGLTPEEQFDLLRALNLRPHRFPPMGVIP
jgi:membrane-associated protease RseP (regulator of RpoE activity)